MTKSKILQFLLRRNPGAQEAEDLRSGDPERRAQALYRLGRTRMREGVLDEALARFDEAIALLPDYAEAIAARAESLDMLGQSQSAAPEYEKARRLWADQPSGAPDRSYLFRQHGRFSFEVDSYELALRRIKTGAFPHLACGNALLAQGRAAEALQFYSSGLKIKKNNPDLTALKGEALSMLGRYSEAVAAFDFALAAQPKAPEVLNARAIARAAQGRIREANADWQEQLKLLGAGQCEARAYVALRLANYETALPEIERALARAPNDAYWQLYRLTALRRLGRHAGPVDLPSGGGWPAALIALHAGSLDTDEVLKQADTPSRRAQAAFQIATIACETDRTVARKRWTEIVDQAPPALLEYGAARNELMRQG